MESRRNGKEAVSEIAIPASATIIARLSTAPSATCQSAPLLMALPAASSANQHSPSPSLPSVLTAAPALSRGKCERAYTMTYEKGTERGQMQRLQDRALVRRSKCRRLYATEQPTPNGRQILVNAFYYHTAKACCFYHSTIETDLSHRVYQLLIGN